MKLTILQAERSRRKDNFGMQAFYTELKKFGHVRANAPLAKFTSFKIGGPAEFLVEVDDTAKLSELLRFVSGVGVDYFVLGGGSNILLPDEGLPGVTIKMNNEQLTINDTSIEVDAGAPLSKVVEAATANSLVGFEWAAGIPGTLGGAVRGNAGARYAFCGGEIKDSLVTALIWQGNDVAEFSNADCRFGYRDSVFKHSKDIVLSATFTFSPGDKRIILETTQKVIAERKGKHASEPSAGSFFKNVFLSEWKRDVGELPPRFLEYKKIAAGWLIEQAGLKGYRVGDALVSTNHANFIINAGKATQNEVLQVVEHVTSVVYNTFGISLEPEVQIVR